MAVLFETSVGDMVIDLFCEDCPIATKNFLKLCKTKYYNNCLFYNVQQDYLVQAGDPTNTGRGGESIYKQIYGDQAQYFDDEIRPQLKHDRIGVVATANTGPNLNASAFYITTRERIEHLDGKHTIFGVVGEGLDVLQKINKAYVDDEGRPWLDIRIRHTIVLDDPFDDPAGLEIPPNSPEPVHDSDRLADNEDITEDTRPDEEIKAELEKKEAKSQAVLLEMIGDLPDADIKPPENILFVCKLNPVTQDEDLHLIFSRFGQIKSCEVIRDWKTGDSLQYAFIEFESQESCEEAYWKMDNTLIDDRRIKVDFSQSVSKLWNRWRRNEAGDADAGKGNYAKTSHQTGRPQGGAGTMSTGTGGPKQHTPHTQHTQHDNKGRHTNGQNSRQDKPRQEYMRRDNRHEEDRRRDRHNDDRRRDDRHRNEKNDRDRGDRSERDRSERDRSERDRSDRRRSDRDRSRSRERERSRR
eukprot:GILK01004339.1.p1 GENE.GILK01004339.1~~GILK01004339.1.p1  ORF type:complete len:495 (-),score=83.96 GILK01004339.1:158-1564(-)